MVAAAITNLIFIVTVCHAENVINARFVSSSKEATALESTLDVQSTSGGVLADDTKQTAGCNQLCESHSAGKQRVMGCATWPAHSNGGDEVKEEVD